MTCPTSCPSTPASWASLSSFSTSWREIKTFPPGSAGAAAIRRAGRCTLTFDAFNQRYDLECRVWKLTAKNPLWQATYWHNALFNPSLPAETVILGFEPDWKRSSADPDPS